MIKNFNLNDKIHLLGYQDNVFKYLKNSKYFILSSLWEDPGFVLIEAALSNTNIISSDCPNGPSEIISDDGGYLFESNSKSSLVQTISHFLKDTEKNKLSKKIKLKKRLKKFTSFYHATNLKNKILNLKE